MNKAVEYLALAADTKGKNNENLYLYAGILAARLGKANGSFDLLQKAVDAGMWDIPRLERNNRLAELREDERWDALIKRIRRKESEYVESTDMSHPELRVELKSMWVKDQDLVGTEKQKSIIDSNSERLKDIVNEYGWPTKSMVGEDGSWFAWAIAQHSFDGEFQRTCLDLMKPLLSVQEINSELYAELHDRISRNANEEQTYGMAIIWIDGKKVFHPISNIESVDQRRQSIGLPPLKVWANENGVAYDSN
ncbi:DUF6624 domain-containing protein [Microbulbifer sp. RZ01]|uniref:DUF6624 domain-containing protein n=1 Tax=Microbulbifer sp. RZ01 TaxID=3021711 RepID=UPI0027E3C1AF|nr:DUF6624 domain-containing protein [Microbulbifer sp. RZ01]